MRCGRRPGEDDERDAQGGRLRGCAAVVGAPGRGSWRPGFRGSASPSVPGHGVGRLCRRHGSCQGAVTAEFAVALPAVLLLFGLLLAGSAAGMTQFRLEEAARAGARALARGEDAAAVNGIVRRLAGGSATSAVDSDGEWLAVTVSDKVAGAVGSLVPWPLTARAWARGESSDSPAVALLRGLPDVRTSGRAA
jgi:hypothetical protein